MRLYMTKFYCKYCKKSLENVELIYADHSEYLFCSKKCLMEFNIFATYINPKHEDTFYCCIQCGEQIKDDHEIFIDDNNLSYCSEKCLAKTSIYTRHYKWYETVDDYHMDSDKCREVYF